jgi:Ca-activated chloride channel family protein
MKMPSHTDTECTSDTAPERSIRDALEEYARTKNPNLAKRMARRLANRLAVADNQDQRQDTTARRIMRWQDRTLLTIAVLLAVLFIIRAETAYSNPQQWGLQLINDTGSVTALALDTDIQLDITGLLARVSITQKFTNSSDHWAEGIYRFPLPAGAAVDRMQVKVDERILEGEIQEKNSARRIYQKARDSGHTTSLVEQQRRNQFETRLANIGPDESIEITIGYLQNVSYADFSYQLRLPMTFTPRWETGGQVLTGQLLARQPAPDLVPVSSTASHSLNLHANLVSSIELAAIESRYHDVDIRQVKNGYRIELLNSGEVTDRDFELSWTPALQGLPSAALSTFNSGESVYAQLMLAPPLVDSIEPLAREVIFVIDTSGSMAGDSLVQAKSALLHALNSLGPDDYFNLLEFNSNTRELFDRPVAVTGADLYRARAFLSGLDADGGTNMAPALESALAMPETPGLIRQVVFITDGSVGNEAQLLQLVAEQLGQSRMFTVSIGYAPNSWFMRKAAEIGRGSHVHIAKPEEVEERMSALWGRIRIPALTDICVDWGGGAAEYYPEIIPDLYAGEPLWLTARLASEPTLIGLCGIFNGSGWGMDVNGWDAAVPGPAGDNLAKIWARKKIEALEDSLMFGADPELTRLEITGLALEYDLLTRYTSLVAVDKSPRRSNGEPLAKSDVPGLLPAGSSTRLAGYPPTATGWLTQLLLSLFVLLLATSMLVFSGSRFPMTKPSKGSL